jgi:hypothetical protein
MNDIRLSLQGRRLHDASRDLSGGLSIGILPNAAYEPLRTSLRQRHPALRNLPRYSVLQGGHKSREYASIQDAARYEVRHEPAKTSRSSSSAAPKGCPGSLPSLLIQIHRRRVIIAEDESADNGRACPARGLAPVTLEPPVEQFLRRILAHGRADQTAEGVGGLFGGAYGRSSIASRGEVELGVERSDALIRLRYHLLGGAPSDAEAGPPRASNLDFSYTRFYTRFYEPQDRADP